MEPIRSIFARHRLRCTLQREEIYRALASTVSHPTAEELFTQVRGKLPGVSLATVYNTLDALVRRGLCRRFATEGSDSARFDADVTNHVHVLTDDGRIRDVPADLSTRIVESLPPEMVEMLEHRLGVRIDGVQVQFIAKTVGTGRC